MKRVSPIVKAHLIRGAVYVFLLLAVCVIHFALGQRYVTGSSGTENSAGTESTPQLPTISSDKGVQATGPVQVPQFPAGNEPGPLYLQYDCPATEPPINIGSQQFEPTYGALSDQAADDFVLFNGPVHYVITQVRVMGEYSAGGGPASSFNLFFYTNGPDNLPGTQIVALFNRPYSGSPLTL